jgi:hypothetical protein
MPCYEIRFDLGYGCFINLAICAESQQEAEALARTSLARAFPQFAEDLEGKPQVRDIVAPAAG